MHITSVNVGTPQQITVPYGMVLTAIFKSPVEGRVSVKYHNIEGDRQADLTVHGGPKKAVYAYPSEHYAYWHEKLPDMELPPGVFGENLTTTGLLETEVFIGDRYRFGSAVLEVTQPRMPCFKLGIRFDRADMVKLFWQSKKSGIYFSITEEGDLAAGDRIECIERAQDSIAVADVVRLYMREEHSQEVLQQALRSSLSGSWKEELLERWMA
jgi:MOSC domain-containing protein YiiM